MDEAVLDILKTFYKGRRDPTSVYDYNDKGDLVEMDKAHKSVVRTIMTLNEYRPLTSEEKAEMEESRREAIAIATKEYDDAKKRLREEVMSPMRSETAYMKLTREVRAADDALFRVRYPLRHVENVSRVPWRDILFDEVKQDERVIPYPLRVLEVSPFPIQETYVRVGKAAEKPLLTLKEIKKAQKENAVKEIIAGPVILVSSTDDGEYGFMSLDWKADIKLDKYVKAGNPIVYHSARQAFAVEMARMIGDMAHVDEFMTMDSPEGIRYTLEDVPKEKAISRVQWEANAKVVLNEVQLAKFMNYPSLASMLMDTGSSRIGAVEPSDPNLGIGLTMDHARAKNPVYWTGTNLIGISLMYAREVLVQLKKAMGDDKKKKVVRRTTTAASTASISSSAAAASEKQEVVQASSSTAVQPAAMPVANPPRVVRRQAKSVAATPAVSTQ